MLEHVQTFSISRTGVLATVGATAARNQLVAVGMDGTERPLSDERRQYLFPAVSPDGRRLAVEIHDAVGGQIWVYDITSGTLTRLTALGHNTRPAWAPDGRIIAYSSARDTASAIYLMPADGSGGEQRVGIADPGMAFADLAWIPGGRQMAYARTGANEETFEAVATKADSMGRPIPGLLSASRPAFSPDGRWVAYASGVSGRLEVYLRPYPGPGGRWLVSASGGEAPVWAPSGPVLYYRGPDGWLYAATLALGTDVQVLRRTRLFDTKPFLPDINYDVFPDGRHFVFVRRDRNPPDVDVTVNWFTELSRRLRTDRPVGNSGNR